MKSTSIFEVISAAHLSYNMTGVPSEFQQRGGIMLVAPPGNLKSTLIKGSLDPYPNALVLSDLNVRQLITIRDDIASQKYCTLGFPDYEKLYQREQETAANLEGHLKGMTEEGFSHTAWEDKRMKIAYARALVVGGMVPTLYKRKFAQWSNDGFLRRFLWVHYVLDNVAMLPDAIHNWEPLSIGTGELPGMPMQAIPFSVTSQESKKLFGLLRFHEGESVTPFVLLKKILSVLKWRFRYLGEAQAADRAMETLEDFAEAFTAKGARVVVSRENSENQKEKLKKKRVF